ncbi:serine/threonine-protein kinase [Sorangium cellulosum]|uniref:serine/threonine-protein kinase n=1 Tax=Sorangium cellulosum TaxID=56 RepID=UPI001F1E5813|nr:serine/threonine-protein kinase [Sorangium cellulosum]
MPGTILLQRYRVLRHLRREGLGDVFSAEDTSAGRRVAVKVLGELEERVDPLKVLGAPERMSLAEAVARFRREAIACARLRGPHTLPSIGGGDDPQHGLVIVFELREGELLVDRLVRRGPFPLAALHPLVEQLWLAIAELHEIGLLHRNICSANVLLDRGPEGERLTLLDLGSCRLPLSEGDEEPPLSGRKLGDVRYVPPEQIASTKAVDHRADIYAATTVVFQALTGELPYAARNLMMLADLKARTAPRRLGNLMPPPVDREVEVFVNRGLAHSPDRRFASIAEVIEGWQALRPAT